MQIKVVQHTHVSNVVVETIELFSLKNIRLLIDKLPFTTVNLSGLTMNLVLLQLLCA